ncbi:MAG: MacS family sensor histidine kinase [Nocardioides sp.]|uniref:MacS family sensor histidine kinase n=1 Tax=Nocardioides sp. TaxID=35761 RepID=UPI003F0CBB02
MAVEDRLFRALAILRAVLTVNMVVLNAYRHENFDHPRAGAVVVGALVAWSVFAVWAYHSPRRRTRTLLVADLAVALAAMALTELVKGGFNATIPGFWVAGALMAWAIYWRTLGGLSAALMLCVCDVAIRDTVDQGNYGNLFLLMIGGPIVGYMVESLVLMADQRDRAERAAAVAEERHRLARAVHDGVLQVLALTQREGARAGGEFAELARLAGEQERSLRSLIHQQETVTSAAHGGHLDLTGALQRLGTEHPVHVQVATPGVAVLMDRARGEELVAAAKACLDNVAAHVGTHANAWVLLEATESSVTVSVRDEGPGIEPGRLDRAREEGRLGVVSSIVGRAEELGGRATVDSGSWGTEWEIEVPRDVPVDVA